MFSMGGGTLAVPMELFALNRRRLCERLRRVAPRGVVLLQGGRDFDLHDTDVTFVFQQVGGSLVRIKRIVGVRQFSETRPCFGFSLALLLQRILYCIVTVKKSKYPFRGPQNPKNGLKNISIYMYVVVVRIQG